MRKIKLIVLILASFPAFSQTTKSKNLADRAADHIMIQFALDSWTGDPDSINSRMKTWSRGANVYVMLDKPFKGNPKLSLAFGLGVGTSSVFFDKMTVDIGSLKTVLPFQAVNDTSIYFDKYKLATSFLEVPLELRFSSNPETPNRSIKFAIGVKGGILLNAHTKGKNVKTAGGVDLNKYTEKVLSKNYFNSTRLAGTARVGYGVFSLFGAFNFTSIFKDGVAADMKLLQIGLTISGL